MATSADALDADGDTEEDPVVLVTGGIVPRGTCYHTNPDCPSIREARSTLEYRVSELEDRPRDYKLCNNCIGERPGDRTQDKRYIRALRQAGTAEEGDDGE